MKKSHKDYIKKAKKEYFLIGSVNCPAFCNELVYFNKYGFNHLIWKGKKMRTPNEQVRRIKLIPKVVDLIKISNHFSNYRKMERVSLNQNTSIAYFWSFKHRLDNKIITIIIRQTNNGLKHFFSVI